MKIPEACLKQSIAIIGRTGSGKTYTAKGLVERILADQARVCIIDPLGVWWGLRSSADGKAPAFPVIVFGGDHADVALTEGMGGALAETLAGQNLPSIVDVSDFSMAGRVRFMATFLEELYVANRSPLTLVVDEADMFAPQRPGKEQLTMLGRMEQICRRGRVRGFRPWLITQRPASLHKAVLSQANTLIAMQLTAPQDRDALGDWIEGQADRVEGKKVLAELPKLAKGEGFVWAPHEGILERARFPRINTYDSSRTPEDGERLPLVKLAAVDLSRIGAKLQELEVDEVDEDPKALRARVRELEEQLASGGEAGAPAEVVDEQAVEEARQEAYERGRGDGFRQALEQVTPIAERLDTLQGALTDTIIGFRGDLARIVLEASPRIPNDIQIASRDYPRATPVARPPRGNPVKTGKSPDLSGKNPGISGLPRGERLVLTAIAQHRHGVTREQITVLTGYKRSTRDAYIQRLQGRGEISIEGSTILATEAGVAALGDDFKPLPKGAALRAYWLERLPEGERKVLEVLTDAWPATVERDAISDHTGYKRSTRDAYLQRLVSRQLVTAERGAARASEVLFK